MHNPKDQVKSVIQTELSKISSSLNANDLAIKITDSIFDILHLPYTSNPVNDENDKSSLEILSKDVNVYVRGGVVQSADSPNGITINIFDYDIDDCEDNDLSPDPTGDLCVHYQF